MTNKENEMNPELIICAANKFSISNDFDIQEVVISAARHYSPSMNKMIDILEQTYTVTEIEQGFITNIGRFVNRKDALEIAKVNNQIRYDIGYEPDELYSEMLY